MKRLFLLLISFSLIFSACETNKTQEKDINNYKELVDSAVSGYFLLATFSDEGPNKCSGLEICKYSELDLQKKFKGTFNVVDSFKENHNTPFETIQNFTFSVFSK